MDMARSAVPLLELAVALGLDWTCGEPPANVHPVVWLGRLVDEIDRRAPATPLARLPYGAALALAVICAAAVPAWLLTLATRAWPLSVRGLALGVALKPAFAWRSLAEHARRVLAPLEVEDLPRARAALSEIVSRPTATLDAPHIAAGAIESVAENASDSIVAPLFWYGLGGLPGVWVYRAVNTMDAMIGYRTEQYEQLGKPAAWLDDILNWLPARLTAALFLVAAAVTNADAAGGRRTLRLDGGRTASPNAGRPMAAMAGCLGVELEKVGQYRLGEGSRLPDPADLRRALDLLRLVALMAFPLAAAIRVAALRLYPAAR